MRLKHQSSHGTTTEDLLARSTRPLILDADGELRPDPDAPAAEAPRVRAPRAQGGEDEPELSAQDLDLDLGLAAPPVAPDEWPRAVRARPGAAAPPARTLDLSSAVLGSQAWRASIASELPTAQAGLPIVADAATPDDAAPMIITDDDLLPIEEDEAEPDAPHGLEPRDDEPRDAASDGVDVDLGVEADLDEALDFSERRAISQARLPIASALPTSAPTQTEVAQASLPDPTVLRRPGTPAEGASASARLPQPPLAAPTPPVAAPPRAAPSEPDRAAARLPDRAPSVREAPDPERPDAPRVVGVSGSDAPARPVITRRPSKLTGRRIREKSRVSAPTMGAGPPATAATKAARFYEAALAAMSVGDHAGADRHLTTALTFAPDEARYVAARDKVRRLLGR